RSPRRCTTTSHPPRRSDLPGRFCLFFRPEGATENSQGRQPLVSCQPHPGAPTGRPNRCPGRPFRAPVVSWTRPRGCHPWLFSVAPSGRKHGGSPMAKKELRVGMIGYGFRGRAHSNAYRQVGQFFPSNYRVVLKAACARKADEIKKFADNWGYESVETDWRKLVERKDIDAIDICTPNNLHKEIAL